MTARTKKEMTDWEIDQWSSHRLIMDPLLASVEMRSVVELGVGRFSTRKIAEAIRGDLVSFESDHEWAEEMMEELSDLQNVAILFSSKKMQKNLEHFNPDLVFVDHSGNRHPSVEESMKKRVPYIVLHDFTEQDEFAINVEDGYELFSTRGMHFNPTALYTTNIIVASAFRQATLS